MLPSFLVIGAAKAGTTWLTRCLHEHPGIFIPLNEIQYFTRRYERCDPPKPDLPWYERWFAEARPRQVVGENSNTYLSHLQTAERIKPVLPEVRLIAVLRNPIDRAYSGYCMRFRAGSADGRIESYLDPFGDPRVPQILDVGRYHRNLQPYLDRFGHEQLLVALFEDVTERPEALFADVCRHIGAEASSVPSLRRRVNAKDGRFVPPAAKRVARAVGSAGTLLGPARKSALYRRFRPLWTRSVEYPPLTPDLRAKLRDYYAPDVARLEQWLGRDLSHWLVLPDSFGRGDSPLTNHHLPGG